MVKQTFFEELSLDNPGGRVTGMRDVGGALLSKSCSYFFGEGFGIKYYGFIKRHISVGPRSIWIASVDKLASTKKMFWS